MTQTFRMVKAPPGLQRRPSRMPEETRHLMRALDALQAEQAICFAARSNIDARRLAKSLFRKIYDARKRGILKGKFSVTKRPNESARGERKNPWFVYVTRANQARASQ